MPLDVLAHAVKQDLAATIREGAGHHPVPALSHVLRQLHSLNPLLAVHDAAGPGRLCQHLMRVTNYYSSANSSLALTDDMESETAFYKKDSYAHYLSYDTLVSTVAIL